ncbi:MAG: hypothetical protein RLY70_940 [Planctomycetota bacterium]
MCRSRALCRLRSRGVPTHRVWRAPRFRQGKIFKKALKNRPRTGHAGRRFDGQEAFHHDRNPLGNVRTRFPRLPPSRRRRPGLQTAIATRYRIPPPAATDKMSVVQAGRHDRPAGRLRPTSALPMYDGHLVRRPPGARDRSDNRILHSEDWPPNSVRATTKDTKSTKTER